MRDEQPASIVGVHTQPYNEIVRPGQVWKISKYFLRRWTPYLSPSEVWLVIGARQLSYFNEKKPWFKAYDRTLAEAAGLHVKVFRRTIKKVIVAGDGHIATFLSKEANPAYRHEDGVTRQTQTRYAVRLDDPLTPGDAAALAYWLRRNSPQRVTPEAISQLLSEASAASPQELRATNPDPIAPEAAPGAEDLRAVADVVAQVFPSVGQSKAWREAADALHTHIVAPELAHFETQYFRRRWLGELGPGPALLLTHLRSLCYHNEESGEIRDRVTLASGALEDLFQISSRTLRRWLARLEEAVAEDDLLGPFYRILDSRKRADQKVATTYWVNLKTPLTPGDLNRYRERLLANGHNPDDAPGADEVTDKKFPTVGDGRGQKVPHTIEGDGQKVGHGHRGKRQKVPHRSEGGGQEVPHREEGDGQKVPGWRTEEGAYKYYKILLEMAGLNTLKDLWKEGQQQQQDVWRVRDGWAKRSFAAVAAEGSLEGLLDRLNIQEPARGTILKQRPSIEEVVAWHLYALQEDGLESPVSYLIKRAATGDPPPLHYLQLASLSWEQWRTYAAVCHLRSGQGPVSDSVAEMPLFDEWRELYADTSPSALPFDVGLGIEELTVGLAPLAGSDGSPSLGIEERTSAPAGTALWQATLRELSHQMARATFDAWLRDSCLVEHANGLFVVGVRNQSAREWLENRLQGLVCDTLASVVEQEEVSVRFVVQDE